MLKGNLIFTGLICAMFGGAFVIGNYLDGKKPDCPSFDTKEIGAKILSKNIGSTNIEGETCHIIEVYNHICYVPDGTFQCKGPYLLCEDKTLSRITKCPSGTVTNSVTRTGGKFPHEEVQ